MNRLWGQILTIGNKSVVNRLNGRLGGAAVPRGRPPLGAARPPEIAGRPRGRQVSSPLPINTPL
jgi:hypothetical protein